MPGVLTWLRRFGHAAQIEWHESAGNHLTAVVSDDGRQFLMNRSWRHCGEMRASDFLVPDIDDPDVMTQPNASDPSCWTIHGAVHRGPNVRVLSHCHPPYATALACLFPSFSLSSGEALNEMPDDLAQKTADGLIPYKTRLLASGLSETAAKQN